jgi:hypothetical protein
MVQNRPIWTEEEKAEVSRLAGQVSLPELARHLKRTEAATRVQASKLGIKLTLRRSDDRGRAPVQAPPMLLRKSLRRVPLSGRCPSTNSYSSASNLSCFRREKF